MGTTTYKSKEKTGTRQPYKLDMGLIYQMWYSMDCAMLSLSFKGPFDEISKSSWRNSNKERKGEEDSIWTTSGWHPLDQKKGYPYTKK